MESSDQPTLESLDKRIQELEDDIRTYTKFVQDYIETRRELDFFALTDVDDLIDDVDNSVTQEEVDRLIAYEKGDAMRLTIRRMDGTSFCRQCELSVKCSCHCVQVLYGQSPKTSYS